ncbi:hypothetical protein BH10ACT10_BH10ACT10_01710 [soil metagenome]
MTDWRSSLPEKAWLSLSVVIPAFNSERTVGRAIESAWSSGANEVIVVDDGSTDGTAAVSRGLRCTLVSQANKGVSAARRRGVAASTGDVVVLLDADDSLVAEGVSESTDILVRRPACALVVGGTRAVAADGSRRAILPGSREITARDLLDRGSSVGPPGAVMWRRHALFEALGPTMPALWPKYAEDYELLIRGTLAGEMASHDVISCEYLMFGGKSSQRPEVANQCAEQIRRHYADLAQIQIRQRSDRELRSLAHVRAGFDRPGSRSAPFRVVHYIFAALHYPPMVVRWLRARPWKVVQRLIDRIRAVR